MQHRHRIGLTAGLVLSLTMPALAHGGMYRGPGDVVPPPAGGGGGHTPGAVPGPHTPGPKGPHTPPPNGPSTVPPSGTPTGTPGGPTPSRGPTTRRPPTLGPDLTEWHYWWEFNKSRFLDLKDAVFATGPSSGPEDFYMGQGRGRRQATLRPTRKEIRDRVVPGLFEALQSTGNRDIRSSCIIALAKIGMDHRGIGLDLLEEFEQELKSPNQELRETAAVALGITHKDAALQRLVHLFLDDRAGRALCARREVDDRTRSFAGYGLALLGRTTRDRMVKDKIRAVCARVLLARDTPGRNVPVSAITALGLLRYDLHEQADGARAALSVLYTYYLQDLGPGRQLIQAHVPIAVSRLLGAEPPAPFSEISKQWRHLLLADLSGRRGGRKLNAAIPQSCALALGGLCRPVDDPSAKTLDNEARKALLTQHGAARDHQVRAFCLMGLARMGGTQVRTDLLLALASGKKGFAKPWAALALGVFQHRVEQRTRHNGPVRVDRLVRDTLVQALEDDSNPATAGAYAVALGLCRYQSAAPTLRRLLRHNESKEDLTGYLALGLALMGDHRSIEDLRGILARSIRKPALLQQVAMALGKLGNKATTEQLRAMMKDENSNLAKMSGLATALGFIGDRYSIDPLLEMVGDTSLHELSRAFAVAALGGIADKEDVRWNTAIAADLNYRAAVETLTGAGAGVLDIL